MTFKKLTERERVFEILKKTEGREYNRHEVACILADAFENTCACNYNGINEWLPYYCDFAEKECPDVVGVACWEQYLKHLKEREENA